MEANEKNIMGALAESSVYFYTIPEFQRPYTWERKNIEQLWDDLYESFNDYTVSLQKDPQTEIDNYFLGPLVFVKNKNRKAYDIIDGQQRVTTLHILLWYIYHKINDEVEKTKLATILLSYSKETRLKVATGDVATFLAVKENLNDISGSSTMAVSANFFKEKIMNRDDSTVLSFWKFLEEALLFIVIETDNYPSAWELFIGLNGKGEPLNPADLIKAHVCGKSDVGEDAAKIWQDKMLPLKTDATFFLLMLTRYKLNKFVSENALFKEFSQSFPNIIRTIDLSTLSETFFKFWLEPTETLKKDFDLTSKSEKYLRLIRDLGRRDHTSLLFKFVESFSLKEAFSEEFLKPLAIFQLRMAVTRKRSRERKFISYFRDIMFDKLETARASIIKFYKSETVSDDEFELFVQSLEYPTLPCRAVLREFEEGERGNKIVKDFQIEHVMPETPTTFWFNAAGTQDKDQYKATINNIGNLFAIDNSTNPEIGNDEFNIKQQAYQKYLPDWSVARVTKDLKQWTPTNISKRATEIAKWAVEKWKFDKLDEVIPKDVVEFVEGSNVHQDVSSMIDSPIEKKIEENVSTKSHSKQSTFSLEPGEYPEEKLKQLLIESLTRDKKLTPGLRAFFEILLSADRTFKREEIKKQLLQKRLKEDVGRTGTLLSNISQLITEPNNAHLRQITEFSSGGIEGQRKDNYKVKSEYRNLLSDVLKNMPT